MAIRAAIYTRVSSEEQAGDDHYSLAAQLRACRKYAEDHGWQIVHEYTDEGKSAHNSDMVKRPEFKALMAAAAQGSFDCVIVHKLNRFCRHVRFLLEQVDILAKHRVDFVSLTEHIDLTTPQGKLMLHVFATLAQFESDNLSQETRKGKSERKAQGLYNGALPYGAAKGPDGVPVADPETHPHLCYLFTLAAQGRSDAQIATALNAKGVLTDGIKGRNPWRKDTVRRVLTNRFYLGELPIFEKRRDHRKPVLIGWQHGKHAVLIDSAVFVAAQAERESHRKERRSVSVPPTKRTYSLSGLLYCAQCGAAVRIGSKPGDPPRIRCYGRVQGLGCNLPHTILSIYESQVSRWVAGIVIDDNAVERAVRQIAAEQATPDDTETERRNVQARLSRIKELYGWGHIERSEYLTEHEQLTARLRVLSPPQQQRRDMESLATLLRDLPRAWQLATPAERNKLLARLVSRVIVDANQVAAVVPRPDASYLLPAWH